MHNSDHYMFLGCLNSALLREYTRYLGGGKRLLLLPPTALTREGGIFAALRRAVPKPLAREARKNAWILAATWRLVNERVSTRRYITKDQALIWRLVRVVKAILREDIQQRADEAGAEVEALMGSDPPLRREAWHWIKRWYKDGVDRAPPLAWVTLKRITAERVDLYS